MMESSFSGCSTKIRKFIMIRHVRFTKINHIKKLFTTPFVICK